MICAASNRSEQQSVLVFPGTKSLSSHNKTRLHYYYILFSSQCQAIRTKTCLYAVPNDEIAVKSLPFFELYAILLRRKTEKSFVQLDDNFSEYNDTLLLDAPYCIMSNCFRKDESPMNQKIQALKDCIASVIVGKEQPVRCVIAGLLCDGHILIEDVPGVGKTQIAAALARSVGGSFNRIQLTPDVMPSDITGFTLVNQQTFALEYRAGAAMCNFLLADEINRASPKVQSSLLEVMEEHQISIDGTTHPLPKPFMVLATQNPVETYGTYHLPEAQMDRFFMRISMGYPSEEEELQILSRTERHNPIDNIVKPVLCPEDILALQEEVKAITVSEPVKRYILRIVAATRTHEALLLGASPRGSIALFKAIKANAFLEGRSYALPDDVKAMAESVLAHRLILSPKGKSRFADTRALVRSVLDSIPVPMEAS